MTVIPFIDPQHTRINERELSVQAAEQYRLNRALAEVKERRRAQRRETRRLGARRRLGLVPRRSSSTVH